MYSYLLVEAQKRTPVGRIDWKRDQDNGKNVFAFLQKGKEKKLRHGREVTRNNILLGNVSGWSRLFGYGCNT